MTEPTSIHPVYVDGPLKGKDFPVLPGSYGVQCIDPDAPWENAMDQIVTYRLSRFLIHSGGRHITMWLGVSGLNEPDVEVVADLLLSDAAKAARIEAS